MMTAAFFPNFKPEDKSVTLNAWHSVLADVDYKTAADGLLRFVKASGSAFAPSVSQILAYSRRGDMIESEAFDLVWRAVCNSTYNSEQEFAALPETIQRAVGSADQLKAWALSEGESLTTIRAQFARSYKQAIQRQQMGDLPPQLEKKDLPFLPDPEEEEQERERTKAARYYSEKIREHLREKRRAAR